MENNENKVTIKLERHKWPDELEKTRKKWRKIAFISASIIVSFILGMLVAPRSGVPFISSNESLDRFEAVYN